MTLALIVAKKDSFYIVTDTLTQNTDDHYFTNLSSKEFISPKHKIGICFAGGAAIGFSNWSAEYIASLTECDVKDYQFPTNYIVSEFIKYIEEKPVFKVTSLHEEMGLFLNNFFQEKLKPLEGKLTADLYSKLIGTYTWIFYKEVTYIYGGFIEEAGVTKTAIYLYEAHENPLKETFDPPKKQVCDDEPVFFANTNAVDISIDQVLKLLLESGSQVTKSQLLENVNYFLKEVIGLAVYHLNHNQDSKGILVSDILHFKELWGDGNQAYRKLSYYDAASITMQVEDVGDHRLGYKLYSTIKLLDAAINTGDIKKYDLSNGTEIALAVPHAEAGGDHAHDAAVAGHVAVEGADRELGGDAP